ncbi:MAG: patatin-like phospholipase family protein [Alphaproteobacteria bacterium]|nr:patatin-like phospholipase family protein [Alphaproteobacteria bacterium]
MTVGNIGIALAGGGPLGAIYEIGALVAIDEALSGVDLADCDAYVGVSSGSFIAAGLANGLTPMDMYRMFIETEAADDPFEPDVLMRPAFSEYGRRLAALPGLFLSAARDYLEAPLSHGFFESFQRLARATPTGILDNSRVRDYMTALFEAPGRTNDFRELRHKLFLVATDLNTGESVPFGAPGWDDVPISLAIQASAALPGLFPPVEIAGRHYVDGALIKTLHASVALREGVELMLCVNPLVPFNAELASMETGDQQVSLIDGGLPVVLAQTFRSIIYSRMQTGMGRYQSEFPKADVVLFEPDRHDVEMFFTNVFSYADRGRLSEHAYQRTRAELRRRHNELKPVFARHGIEIDQGVLTDKGRSLSSRTCDTEGGERQGLLRTTEDLDKTLDRLEGSLAAGGYRP